MAGLQRVEEGKRRQLVGRNDLCRGMREVREGLHHTAFCEYPGVI